MHCPYCLYEETKVLETRENDNSTRRRWECLSCEKRFTTHERVETIELIVLKKTAQDNHLTGKNLRKEY